jgi:adenylate kinase family enzyme
MLAAIMDVDDEECAKRMRARRRTDDTEAVIQQRLAFYDREQRTVIDEALRTGLFQSLIVLKRSEDVIGRIRSELGT